MNFPAYANYLNRVRHKKSLLLISLDWTRPKDPPMSLAHASMLALLHKHNHKVTECSFAVNHRSFSIEEVLRYVSNNLERHTHFAVGAYIWNDVVLKEILRHIRRTPWEGEIILGGPQVSYTKANVEKYYPDADVFIRGYAEHALVDFLDSPHKQPTIRGIHYKGKLDEGLSASAELEELPSPYLEGIIKPQPFIRWETQRGCPFRCAFCQHRESDSSMIRRYINQNRIMDEIRWITSNAVIDDIAVLDPIFNSGPHYLNILHGFTRHGYKGKISLQCRAEMVKPEFIHAVTQLNKQARVVLEFGLQSIHKHEQKLIDRGTNLEKVRSVLIETKNAGIETEVTLIFGLPGQTIESFQASINFCQQLEVPVTHAFPLMLLRGTPLHDRREELGLVVSDELEDFKLPRICSGIPHVVASSSFTSDDWLKMVAMAEKLEESNQQKSFKQKIRGTI